CARGPVAMDYW
nr:immunoglobulin heavy chain junction region [Mus musculus]MBK4198228.1 immunoglobulin heavy chain junction region [Mus musculus]MBK4198229.1 immunoglobulin heavy chain junction region [Mus musculus]MBK4198230.1 immunoglobulin heavy chain junction region [Mus musculus]MBK4198231.1 immunoglobulin heavy chain junction region [Mus musculus]